MRSPEHGASSKENGGLAFEVRREHALEFAAGSMRRYRDFGDEEAIFMLALTLDHHEWETETLAQIKRHKPHVQDVGQILERLRSEYAHWQAPDTQELRAAVLWWADHVPDVRVRIARLLSYFHPTESAVAGRVIIVPADGVLPSRDSGRSFHVGSVTIIMSHTGNLDNLDHEFLHGIINPLTERFAEELSAEQIVALASGKLKDMYGEHPLSLLNEELIRTYNDYIKSGRFVRTFPEFKQLIESLDDRSFTKLMEAEPDTKARLSAVGISSLADLKVRLREYYDRYEKNELRNRIFRLYEDFNQVKTIHPNLSFADFFAAAFKQLLRT